MTEEMISVSVKGNYKFVDWGGFLDILDKAYEVKEFVLIIGPQGCGKTALVKEFCERKGLMKHSINFSLRTRESHLVGSIELVEGNTEFQEGILVKSMREGSVLELDEINSSEPDMLIRLDECLDDRRQITLKENSGEVVVAEDTWFVIATINPISFAGIKEMPPQLNSRFPIRIGMSYPDAKIEQDIVFSHTGMISDKIERACRLATTLRERSERGDLPYSPSIRETIGFANMLKVGMSSRDAARATFKNVYYQWGVDEARKVEELIVSLWEE